MRTIEIDNRLYSNIEAFCQANALEPSYYIHKVLRERLAIDKYGDLNEKFRKIEEPLTPNEVYQEPEAELYIVPQETVTEEERVEKSYDVSEPGDFAKAMEVLGNEEKPKKKRTLKTK